MLIGKGWNFEVLRMRRVKPAFASPQNSRTRVFVILEISNWEAMQQRRFPSSEYAEVIGIETIRSYPLSIIGPQPSNTYDETPKMP
jgi:hypothetical protein